ncbi:DUF2569 domain-containing protein [Pasteurella atlantica]|uniref:DUF2569 domain-containing protein n=1 Tax=Pasteurella atlantica TaxID=2827233 RepID=A0AAW8CRQ1_9PAST|nr:DUF2569 domain-containing protein [Pasteurella atlantica]MBR0574083.1 DUF2569 domain-containing protein [Pasteurella atlantica]MDP8033100.1 DUF2569 domain-containing protein [Pasteurella atlantica]MDP8035037.1 DUF2569 domain-containing protein [Pasteurella atlantica]MDP8037003.1 DUF2569 domain-containing protein [Pasteurella atlantica]MDP8040093.1 DUF2569 domain-containing protein [Pasteurella atlantica]
MSLEVKKKRTQEIGGWLVLLGITIILSFLKIIYFISQNLYPFLNDGYLELFTSTNSEYYIPYFMPLFIFELTFNIIFLLLWFYVCALFFSKNYKFPKYYIYILLANLGFVTSDTFLSFSVMNGFMPNSEFFDKETITPIIKLIISCAIWIPYLKYSKRVKNTFVEKKPIE